MNLRVIPGRVIDSGRAPGRLLSAITDDERLAMIRCTSRRLSGDDSVSTWQVDFFGYGRRTALAHEIFHVVGPFAENGLASLDALLRDAGLTRWGPWRMSINGDFMEGGCCEDFDDPLG
jgi:hypothetical protein